MLRLPSSCLRTSLIRGSHGRSVSARTYVTADMVLTSEPELPPPSDPIDDRSRTGSRRRLYSPRVDSASTHQTVKVETSRPIQNTVEAYALLRALEKEYGPAQEYQFARDSNYSRQYASTFAVDFQHAIDIPESGRTIEVVIPARENPETTIEEIMNGGPGLEALRSYLQPVTRSNSQPLASPEDAVTSLGGETGQVQKDAPKPGSEVVELRLQISPEPYQYRSKRAPITSEPARRAIGTMFVQWGGFTPATAPAADDQAAALPPRMQAAFGKLREQLGAKEFAFADAQRLKLAEPKPPAPKASRPATTDGQLPQQLGNDGTAPPQSSTVESSLIAGLSLKRHTNGDARTSEEAKTEEPRRIELERRVELERQADEERRTTADAWANFKYPTDNTAMAPAASIDAVTAVPAASASPPPEAAQVSVSEKARRLVARRAALQSGMAAPADEAVPPVSVIKPKDAPMRLPKHARRESEEDTKGVVTRMRDFFGV